MACGDCHPQDSSFRPLGAMELISPSSAASSPPSMSVLTRPTSAVKLTSLLTCRLSQGRAAGRA